MIRSAGPFVLAVALVGLAPETRAEDPPSIEILHAPRQVIPAAPVWVVQGPPPWPYQRINRYDVWQYYGVDQFNHWRPRVAYTPYGAFYLANGQPYGYAATHPRQWMSYVTEVAN